MSMLEKYTKAINNKDESTMNELLHNDFKFTMHKSGNTLGKADVIKWAMSGDINQDKARVVYENVEVGVHHSVVTFNDGNVMAEQESLSLHSLYFLYLTVGHFEANTHLSQIIFAFWIHLVFLETSDAYRKRLGFQQGLGRE